MEGLQIEVQSAIGSAHGLVSDVRVIPDGAKVVATFGLSEAPRVPLNAEISLSFSGAPLPRPVAVKGRLLARSREDLFERATFQLDPRARAALLPQVSRRMAVRVRPSPVTPVGLQIAAPSVEPFAADCLDISVVGAAARFPIARERTICHVDELDLQLLLPGSSEPIFLPARVRQRKLLTGAVQYGLAFILDEAQTLDARIEARLQAYVMERQQQMLRAAGRPVEGRPVREAS